MTKIDYIKPRKTVAAFRHVSERSARVSVPSNQKHKTRPLLCKERRNLQSNDSSGKTDDGTSKAEAVGGSAGARGRADGRLGRRSRGAAGGVQAGGDGHGDRGCDDRAVARDGTSASGDGAGGVAGSTDGSSVDLGGAGDHSAAGGAGDRARAVGDGQCGGLVIN